MNQELLTIMSNDRITDTVYDMVLSGNSPMLPGQFIEMQIPGFFLRRPFSVAEYQDGFVRVIYKVQGRGTEAMTALQAGQEIDALTGLGRGFSLSGYSHPLLIGGGIGVAPLLFLARVLFEREKQVTILLCGRTKEDLIKVEEFERYGKVYLATDDGSLGLKGNALDIAKQHLEFSDRYYACGPMPMLKSLAEYSKKGELSLEAHMGCGFGACMGCTIKTTEGPKRVCKEGPVFFADTVIFD